MSIRVLKEKKGEIGVIIAITGIVTTIALAGIGGLAKWISNVQAQGEQNGKDIVEVKTDLKWIQQAMRDNGIRPLAEFQAMKKATTNASNMA